MDSLHPYQLESVHLGHFLGHRPLGDHMPVVETPQHYQIPEEQPYRMLGMDSGRRQVAAALELQVEQAEVREVQQVEVQVGQTWTKNQKQPNQES